jgi:hypothetical protein
MSGQMELPRLGLSARLVGGLDRRPCWQNSPSCSWETPREIDYPSSLSHAMPAAVH